MNGIQSTHISSDWCASRGIRDGVGLDAISSVAFVLVVAVLILSLPGRVKIGEVQLSLTIHLLVERLSYGLCFWPALNMWGGIESADHFPAMLSRDRLVLTAYTLASRFHRPSNTPLIRYYLYQDMPHAS